MRISKESLASYDENGVKVANGGYILEVGTWSNEKSTNEWCL